MNKQNKKKLSIFLLLFLMLVIVVLWLTFSPPNYFNDSGKPGFFDTIKQEFSNF